MDISKPADIPTNTASRPLTTSTDLIQQLLKLGSIEAKVGAISKGQAILLTQLGQISSPNTLGLKTGDQLLIRAGGDTQTPVLKIQHLPAKPLTLDTVAQPKLAKLLVPDRSMPGLIIGQKPRSSLLQIGNQRIHVNHLIGLKVGQPVSLLKHSGSSQIEVRPINQQQVLKSALSRLMPSQPSHQGTSALTQLINLIRTVAPALRAVPAVQSGKFNPISKLTANVQSASPATNPLRALVSSMPDLSRIDKSVLRQWVTPLLKAEPTSPSPIRMLLQQTPTTEPEIYKLIQQLVTHSKSGTAAKKADVKLPSQDSLPILTKDIVKLVTQSNDQQLLQQANLRYQQELQQPIALTIAIPFDDNQKTRELRLKIRQQAKEDEPQNQCWDIHFDFEFGLLGLISTHLILDDNTLSASFWSALPETQAKIDKNLTDFKQQLSRAGFELGLIQSFQGKAPDQPARSELSVAETLLDIRV